MEYEQLLISCDGGSRGNPGPSAVGVLINAKRRGSGGQIELIASFGRCIGITTNNVAEYQSVLAAFEYLVEKNISAESVSVMMDSQLVSRQLSGQYKITKPHLRTLWNSVKALEPKVSQRVVYQSVAREQNHQADLLVNAALDFMSGS